MERSEGFPALGRVARSALVLACLATAQVAGATVQVAALIGDHMMVQQGKPVHLWGTAAPGEAVRAALGGVDGSTRADALGRWAMILPALSAGGPWDLTIQGSEGGEGSEGSKALSFKDVWSGEVWIASGQSNMELVLARSAGAEQAIASGCPGVRLFTVTKATSASPRTDVSGTWRSCDAETARDFSAVAFHFGQEIHRALAVPVGLIHASWGGTPAQAWTSREALAANESLEPMIEALDLSMRDEGARAAAARRLADWEAKTFYQDTGNVGEARGFARVRGTGGGWLPMKLPQLWEDAGLLIDGAVWFRREVVLPTGWEGADLALSLGAIDDFDVTYWNGDRIAATGHETPEAWTVPRWYTVPGRLVRSGRNVIAVRVFDHFGSGGFAGPASQMTVRPTAPAEPTISLAGSWSYKVERGLKPASADFSQRPQLLGADNPTSPTVLWNAMIAPLARLPVAGVIWYQGESNTARAEEYRTLFPTMIRAWRSAWSDPGLPFVFVQLPNFEAPGASSMLAPLGSGAWAGLREAQAATLSLPRTAMAVTLDIGEHGDIHPHNKREVGRRLALQALRTVYRKDVFASGPILRSALRRDHDFKVTFSNATNGLVTADGEPPKGFMLAGVDRVWHWADARIEGDSVVVFSADVPDPVAVRYAWANDPPNTLRNQADLPAAPFRTDDWPATAGTARLRPP